MILESKGNSADLFRATDKLGGKNLAEVSDDYGAGDYYDDPDISFRTVLGEGDDDAPFVLEVDVMNGRWESVSGIWVLGYVPNGSENPASRPVPQTAGGRDRFGHPHKLTGTEFENPGKDLELLPEPLKGRAIDWIEKEVQKAMSNYKPENPRDYEDRDDPWLPNWGVHGQERGYYRAD